jgi:hypothetical protein
VEYACRDPEEQWIVTVRVEKEPATWVVSSGPSESVEAGCTAVIDRLAAAGIEVPVVTGRRVE